MFKKFKDMLFNNKEDNQEEIKEEGFIIPVSGKIISLDDVADKVFSERMMGDGFAIEPENGEVFSPVDGIITAVFPTKHAISIKSNYGVEILIHFGLDTVKLNGEGFEVYVEQGSSVNAGDKLLKVNLDEIRDKVPSLVVPIVFIELNGKSFSYNAGKVTAKEKNAIILE